MSVACTILLLQSAVLTHLLDLLKHISSTSLPTDTPKHLPLWATLVLKRKLIWRTLSNACTPKGKRVSVKYSHAGLGWRSGEKRQTTVIE